MTTRHALAYACAAVLVASCASVSPPSSPSAGSAQSEAGTSVHVVDLAPTANGAAVDGTAFTTDAVAALGKAPAGVVWASAYDPGGSVLFFDDRVVCIRHPRALGTPIGNLLDASPELDPDLTRVDFQSAEVEALERGLDLNRAQSWLLMHVDIANETAADVDAAKRRGTAMARQLVANGLTRDVNVAVVVSAPPGPRLLLLPRAERAAITDELGVIVTGPVAADQSVIDVLQSGPETKGFVNARTTVIVWKDGERTDWEAPPETYTQRDLVWTLAFDLATSAITRGCTFETSSSPSLSAPASSMK